jgi:hypothetical protein
MHSGARAHEFASRHLDHENAAVGILVTGWHSFCSIQRPMHATFIQKVIICMIAGFLAASLLQWGKVFVTGADDALNAGYAHRAP